MSDEWHVDPYQRRRFRKAIGDCQKERPRDHRGYAGDYKEVNAEHPQAMLPEQFKPADDGAKKHDGDKIPVVAGALNYFPRALLGIATDSEYGFRKYRAWGGWRNVADGQRRYTDADGRHLIMEPIEGLYDGESGIAHAIMHAWNAMARLEKMLEEGVIELRFGNQIGLDGKPIPGTHRKLSVL